MKQSYTCFIWAILICLFTTSISQAQISQLRNAGTTAWTNSANATDAISSGIFARNILQKINFNLKKRPFNLKV